MCSSRQKWVWATRIKRTSHEEKKNHVTWNSHVELKRNRQLATKYKFMREWTLGRFGASNKRCSKYCEKEQNIHPLISVRHTGIWWIRFVIIYLHWWWVWALLQRYNLLILFVKKVSKLQTQELNQNRTWSLEVSLGKKWQCGCSWCWAIKFKA